MQFSASLLTVIALASAAPIASTSLDYEASAPSAAPVSDSTVLNSTTSDFTYQLNPAQIQLLQDISVAQLSNSTDATTIDGVQNKSIWSSIIKGGLSFIPSLFGGSTSNSDTDNSDDSSSGGLSGFLGSIF